MKLNNVQVFESYPALKSLSGQYLSAKTALKIALTLKAIEPAAQVLMEQRDKLIMQFGTPVTKEGSEVATGQFSIPPENIDAYSKEMQTLMDTEDEYTIDKYVIHVEDLVDHEGQSIPIQADSLITLDWFVLP